MSAEGPLLDAERIRGLLTELGRRLHARGITARIFLVGGAAMALAYNARRATRDLDGVFEPKTEIYAEAALMADEAGLPPDWLNDGVKGLLPDRSPVEIGSHFDSEGISVGVASAEYLFAMKAFAAEKRSMPKTSDSSLSSSASETLTKPSTWSSGSMRRTASSLSPSTCSRIFSPSSLSG